MSGFGIPKEAYWQYLALRHWVTQPHVQPHTSHPLTKFEVWFITRTSDRRLLSDIYTFLNKPQNNGKSPAQSRWESELEHKFSPKEWQDIIHRARASACSMAGKEMLLKIAHYFYSTSASTAQRKPGGNDRCWRNCRQPGTLTHILWQCPKIQTYWDTILRDIDTIHQTEIPGFPSYSFLDLPNPITYPLKSGRGRAITLALGAAKQT